MLLGPILLVDLVLALLVDARASRSPEADRRVTLGESPVPRTVSSSAARRFRILQARIAELEPMVDRAYETGAHDAERLDASLTAAREELEWLHAALNEEGEILPNDELETSIDEYLVRAYRIRLDDPLGDDPEAIRMWRESVASVLHHDYGVEGVTPEQAEELAREAFGRRARLRRAYLSKPSRTLEAEGRRRGMKIAEVP
jgi:hypothetical protein